MHRIGIDLGGTKIEVAVIDDDGRFLLRERVPTPRGDYEATLAAIAALIASARSRSSPDAPVGIGIPGSIDEYGLVQGANSVALIGRPFQRDIERAIGTAIACENDANCMIRSEVRGGAADGAHSAFGIILGTGVGGSFAIAGEPLRGRVGIAGEWGHTPLPWPDHSEVSGPPCYCGRTGCIEAWLSGPSFEREYRASTGSARMSRDIIAAMRAGEAAACAAFDRYVDRLARALAVAIDFVDPDCIVVGGGMSNVQELYAALPARVAPHVFRANYALVIRPAVFGDSSGVRGAALLATP